VCLPISSKFLTESTGEKIVKIGQYLAKIWTKYDSLLFLGHPVNCRNWTKPKIKAAKVRNW